METLKLMDAKGLIGEIDASSLVEELKRVVIDSASETKLSEENTAKFEEEVAQLQEEVAHLQSLEHQNAVVQNWASHLTPESYVRLGEELGFDVSMPDALSEEIAKAEAEIAEAAEVAEAEGKRPVEPEQIKVVR